MDPISLHPIIFYSLFLFITILAGMCIFFFVQYYNTISKDLIIFLDNSNRWRHIWDNIKETASYKNKSKSYIVGKGILNRRGKGLYIYSDNKPNPMNIEYNSTKWLSSESLMAVINNNLIQKLVQPADAFKDKLLLFGAIGGIVAGLASVVVLLKTTGVL